MLVTFEVPQFWVLTMPCGCVDGLMHGSLHHANAEQVWKTFERRAPTRARLRRQGWDVHAGTPDEVSAASRRPENCGKEGHV